MERRYDTRFSTGLPVQVASIDNPSDPATGVLLNISVSGICTLLPVQLLTGSVVQLSLADTVLFGHVAYAVADADSFRTGIAVERVLVQSSDLANILESVLDGDQVSACCQMLADATRA